MSLHELDKFIGWVVALGMIGGRNFSLMSFWGKSWVVKCFCKPCQEIDLLKLWDFFALTWKRKDVKIFCRINLLSFHNLGTASYQTAKKHSFHNGTLQWMSSCCHVSHDANSSSIWPISLTNLAKFLSCSWCRKQILIQRLSLRRKRRYKKQWHVCVRRCCAKAHGSTFSTGLQCHVCQLFYLTWSCFETSREKVQSCWYIAPEYKKSPGGMQKEKGSAWNRSV